MKTRRTNKWALAAIVRCDQRTKVEVSRDAEIVPSTLTDLLSGRRDASEELLARVAGTLHCDVRAISADPFGMMPALERLVIAARDLAPHLNGHDFGLRDALAELDQLDGEGA